MPGKRVLFSFIVITIIIRTTYFFSPIIGAQSWRQADTAAITRNFYEENFNLLFPQIDWGGNTPGYVECEFPIYQFIVALFYKVFGVHEFIGRLISIFFSIISI